jgi:hypothetical protein
VPARWRHSSPSNRHGDFDLLMLPNQRHGYGDAGNYMTRRRWDYFVKYLLNVDPPKEYELKPLAPAGRSGSGQ